MGILVALTWGMGIVFAKAAIDYFPPMLLMAIRSTITACLLVWFLPLPRGEYRKLFWIASISGTAQFGLTLTGLKYIDASSAALLAQLEVPFLVLLGVVVLKERVAPLNYAGIVLAILGALFLAGEPRFNGAWLYLSLVVAGALAWAVGQLMVRGLQNTDGLVIVAWVAVFSAPQLFAASAVFESGQIEALQSAGWLVWSAVIYLSLIMTVAGYGMWYSLVRSYEVRKVAPFVLLMPVFSVLGGLLFLGESLTTGIVVGGMMIIAGVFFAMRERAPQRLTTKVGGSRGLSSPPAAARGYRIPAE